MAKLTKTSTGEYKEGANIFRSEVPGKHSEGRPWEAKNLWASNRFGECRCGRKILEKGWQGEVQRKEGSQVSP